MNEATKKPSMTYVSPKSVAAPTSNSAAPLPLLLLLRSSSTPGLPSRAGMSTKGKLPAQHTRFLWQCYLDASIGWGWAQHARVDMPLLGPLGIPGLALCQCNIYTPRHPAPT